MRGLILVIAGICLAGCQSFGGRKTKSGWYTLDLAQELSCSSWPQQSKDLKIDDVMPVLPDYRGFVVSVTRRDGSPGFYFADFSGDTEIEPEKLVPLNFGRFVRVAGAVAAGGQALAGVLTQAGGKQVIEIRKVPQNIVLATVDLKGMSVAEARLSYRSGGFWLILRVEGYKYRIISGEVKGDAVTTRLLSDEFADMPLALNGAGKESWLIVREGSGSSGDFGVFLADHSGNVSRKGRVRADVRNGLESWSAAIRRNTLHLAVVDGDSLVGGATFRVFSADAMAPQKASQVKAWPLRDEHTSEPVFLEKPGISELLLLKWIDEESTIARYMVGAGSANAPKHFGIFPKGARIMAAFTARGEDEFLVVRHKVEDAWSWQICEL